MTSSIALATFNGAEYLAQQLESFRRQDCLPDELVVSDDASTDDTISVLEAFAADAPFPVRIHRNPSNLGFAQNFSRALSLCTGDLIFLSDQDDYWFPTKIETIASLAQDDEHTQVFINDAELTDDDLNPAGVTKLGQIRSTRMSDDAFVQGSCVAVRREFLRLILPVPPEPWGHDAWIVGFARALGRARIVPEALQYYRRHSANASQFIANDPRKLPRLLLVRQMLSHSKGFWRDESARIGIWSDRLDLILAGGHAGPEMTGELQDLSRRLTAKQAALQVRLALLEKPRPRRMLPVAAMLLRGRYQHFAGLRTAVRDILAPQAMIGPK
jgi:glycosyltransferase involved in cell wall biosynthesis